MQNSGPQHLLPDGGVASPDAWFAAKGWQPFAFQREVWAAMEAGRSGLLHATTGSGKTYAVWGGVRWRAAVHSACRCRARMRRRSACSG